MTSAEDSRANQCQWEVYSHYHLKIPAKTNFIFFFFFFFNGFFLYFKHFQFSRKLEHKQDLNHSAATLLLSFYQNIIGFKIIIRFLTKLMNSRKVRVTEAYSLPQCLLPVNSNLALAELRQSWLLKVQEYNIVR